MTQPPATNERSRATHKDSSRCWGVAMILVVCLLTLLLVMRTPDGDQRDTTGLSSHTPENSASLALEAADSAIARAKKHLGDMPEAEPAPQAPLEPAQVATPAPTVALITNANAGVTRMYTFPKVFDVQGTLAATEARLIGFGGTMVYFVTGVGKPDKKPQFNSMDMDRLPPSFYNALNLNKEDLKKADDEQGMRRKAEDERRNQMSTAQLSVASREATRVHKSYTDRLREEKAYEAELDRQQNEINQIYAMAASIQPPPQRYRIIDQRKFKFSDYCTTCHAGQNRATLGIHITKGEHHGPTGFCPGCKPVSLISSLNTLPD